MKNSVFLFLLLSCAAVRAQEDSDLDRLARETRRIADLADVCLVRVSGGVTVAPYLSTRGHEAVALYAAVVGTSGARTVAGVLVGSPLKVVVPEAAVGTRETVDVTFGDGTKSKARRIDSDADLGLAVYALEGELPETARAVRPEASWDALRRGTLAVVATGNLELTLIQGADRARGVVRTGQPAEGRVLLGAGGRLLGIGATGRSSADQFLWIAVDHDSRASLDPLTGRAGRVAQYPYYQAKAAPQAPAFVAGPVIARVVEDIETHGRIRHGYVGVVLGDADGGVTIGSVLDGSPAAEAGLKPGERVAALDGEACATVAELSLALAQRRPGDVVTLTVGAPARTVKLKLVDRREAKDAFVTPALAGLTCVELGPELRAFLGEEDSTWGVVVRGVGKGSPAAKAGLKNGDVITYVGKAKTTNLEELDAAFASATGSLYVAWRRAGKGHTGTIELPGPGGKSKAR